MIYCCVYNSTICIFRFIVTNKKIQIGKKNYKIPEVEKSKNLVERKAMALKETAKNFMK